MVDQYRSLFKNKQFIYLWISQLFSQLTIQIVNFSLLIYLFKITGSTIATSFLWVSFALPAILIGPFAAMIVDMVDRKKILMIANLAQATVIFFYSAYHKPYFFLLYGAVFAYSFLNQFYMPAELASIPFLVKKKNLANANSLFFLTQQAALIAGFGVAGLLNQSLGLFGTLKLSSFFLLSAFVSVSLMPKMDLKDKIPSGFEKMILKFFKGIFEGYNFIKRRKDILIPFVLLISMQIGLIVVMVNIPAVAFGIFNISPENSGVRIVIPAGVGAALGAIIIPKLLKSGDRKKKIIENSLVLLAFLIFLLVFIPLFSTGNIRVVVSLLLVLLAGFSFIGVLIPSQTYLQEATPGGMRGRVFGNFWFLNTLATVLPVIFSGTVTELFGIKFLFILMSGAVMGAYLTSKKYGQKILES